MDIVMDILKGIYQIAKALLTAPDVLHWINKYEAAKKRIKELEDTLEKAQSEKKS